MRCRKRDGLRSLVERNEMRKQDIKRGAGKTLAFPQSGIPALSEVHQRAGDTASKNSEKTQWNVQAKHLHEETDT